MLTLVSHQRAPRRVPLWNAAVHSFRALAASRRGAVAIEFAMVVPLLVLLILGGFDIGRYALVHQKVQRTAATVADLLASQPILTDDTIDDIMAVSSHVMRPFDFGDNARVIASMIVLETNASGNFTAATTVSWQRCWIAPGHTGLAAASEYGTTGNTPNPRPPGFAVLPGDTNMTVMVAEVVYQHEYLFMDFLGDETPVHATAVYLPRATVPTGLSITDNCGAP